MKKIVIAILFFLTCAMPSAFAQTFALKTNALYWAAGGSMNLTYEQSIHEQWSLELTVGYNPWMLDKDENSKLKHILVMPEVRYWICSKFAGHFIGAHLLYSHYNVGSVPYIPVSLPTSAWVDLRDHRVQGDAGGIGFAYGYNWILSKHLSLEAEIGIGAMLTGYGKYECQTCGSKEGDELKWLFLPTKLALNLVYYIK